MQLWTIILIVFILYIRTVNYKYIIDDIVKREGYLFQVPLAAPPASFWKTRPSIMYRLFMIGMHCVNVSIIYMLWGWAPALLFAVHPMSVWGVAWVTGNYYATATYFTLIAYYIIHFFPNIFGAMASMFIFAAALNSTVCPIAFPFIFLFTEHWGLVLFFPLAMFLFGNRFRTGYKIRRSFHARKGVVDESFTWRRIFVMPKVVARYIYEFLYPNRLCLFNPFGRNLRDNQNRYDRMHSPNQEFWYSLILCLSVFIFGLMVNPLAVLWFFVVIGVHSQWNLTGQFYAQRYLYLPMIGLCVIIGQLFQGYPIVIAIIATFFAIRTHLFIPSFGNIKAMWVTGVEAYPAFGSAYNSYAQYLLNSGEEKHPHDINEISYLLTKAIHLEPESWEIHMNLACFYVFIGRLDLALQYTDNAINILKPLGGIDLPLKQLEGQRVRILDEMKRLEEEKKKGGEGEQNV